MSHTHDIDEEISEMVMRPNILYESKCWPIKKYDVSKMTVAVRWGMLKWISGKSLEDTVTQMSASIENLMLASIDDELGKKKLRWIKQVQ